MRKKINIYIHIIFFSYFSKCSADMYYFYIITCSRIFMQIITKDKSILVYQKFRADFEFWVEHLVFSYFFLTDLQSAKVLSAIS